MKGVDILIDENKNPKAVLIEFKTLDKYQDIIEDLLDGIIAERRKNEEKIPYHKVKENLTTIGKL